MASHATRVEDLRPSCGNCRDTGTARVLDNPGGVTSPAFVHDVCASCEDWPRHSCPVCHGRARVGVACSNCCRGWVWWTDCGCTATRVSERCARVRREAAEAARRYEQTDAEVREARAGLVERFGVDHPITAAYTDAMSQRSAS